ncbi:2-oxo acid dehydrogenase subunit E2 [Novosphingobium taihuense]|uniref:Dihydrolipoyllysine-residue acetyltransferase component of pyruvate dehydrogenase complex n=1 Tax=Novosphingobium taihuense TaxID=260085 RepID=A0A7W7AEZ3_9SPHN|nr:2-oxo acid dehydrogenase subunit E2 [Novosphingobium taihuense]MBB4615074.1 pyruvate dehydrogenase E2 component (dihydrolipoamide acetyltransferase) [Novosphingobium taihuense]TWH79307.1 pyruvate dehydrogenase E2 component (dihydrolipoamide acetyltransferase) [Novosphingobium taihuense]
MSDGSLTSYLAQFGEVEAQPLSKFQQVVARRLSQSWTQIPHVTHHDEVDVSAVDQHRKALAAEAKVTPVIYVAKALAILLQEFPQFNASLSEDGKSVIAKRYMNVGIAVDGPLGLMVPVLRDVAAKSLVALSAELRELSEQARSKGLPMAAMEGGCMTITSLGGIGGTAFTPIINQPEVAILGITRTQTKAVWNGSAFEPRSMMPLSLSYDHRVINGADAARFLRRLNDLLATPEAL